ncbi:MAG: hypothetical protein KAS32_13680 [Candidatus Peribacteraceae bacterium]|nr:hypothetical protein [Candidatus Peribacteraceae bacterium]
MCLDWFRIRKYGIGKAKDTKKINHQALQQILQAQLKNDTFDLTCVFKDLNYKIAPKSEYERMISHDQTNNMLYTGDDLDCDDFAARLHGAFCIPGWSALAFGEVICRTPKGYHAINCFVDTDTQVWLVEPQDDSIWKAGEKGWSYYSAEFS